jgi:hypothetical protein
MTSLNTGCRRKNWVGAAVVEAAIKIHVLLGRERAKAMMVREGIPGDVIARILDDRQFRTSARDSAVPKPAELLATG